jgi:hypothetical protein
VATFALSTEQRPRVGNSAKGPSECSGARCGTRRLLRLPDDADRTGIHRFPFGWVSLLAPPGVQPGDALKDWTKLWRHRMASSTRLGVAASGRSAGVLLRVAAAMLAGGCQDWSAQGSRTDIAPCPPPLALADYFGEFVASNLRSLKPVLDGAGAPSLSCGGYQPEAYRLVFEPSGGRPSHIVTLADEGGTWHAEAIDLALIVRSREYTVLRRHPRRRIPESEVGVLRRGLERASYWTVDPIDQRMFDDGNTIAIEARTESGYRVVLRRSPLDGPFVRTAFLFFELAGLPYPEGEPLPWEWFK